MVHPLRLPAETSGLGVQITEKYTSIRIIWSTYRKAQVSHHSPPMVRQGPMQQGPIELESCAKTLALRVSVVLDQSRSSLPCGFFTCTMQIIVPALPAPYTTEDER